MLYFYLFTLFSALIRRINGSTFFLVLICVCFLIFLPDTGFDYSSYKHAYDNSYFLSDFPWFYTDSYLTAEPFFKWYISLVANLIPFGYPYFLAFNYLLCTILLFVFLLNNRCIIKSFLFYTLPVIFPVLMYWSPRSSISFVFVIGGLIYLIRKKYFLAVLCLFLGCGVHSQYLLFSFLLVILYIALRILPSRSYKSFSILSAIVLFVFLREMDSLINVLVSLLSFLPSAEVVTGKMHYFEEGESAVGFRLTSVLSILIFPYLSWSLIRRMKKTKTLVFGNNIMYQEQLYILYLFFAIFLYGCSINLAFFDVPHLAGRLARFSDYLGMAFLLPLYIKYRFGDNMLSLFLFFLCAITPFLYKDLYINVF